MSQKPDYEIDAYLRKTGEANALCDLRIWLPVSASGDARIEATAFGVDADEDVVGVVDFLGEDPSGQGRFRYEAKDVLIRQARSKGGRLAGGVTLTISHIGTLLVEQRWGATPDDLAEAPPRAVRWVLSQLSYGLPHHDVIEDYKGNRKVNSGLYKKISLGAVNSLDAPVFSLEQHWTWRDESETCISASANTVLSLPEPGDHSLESLTTQAEDICLLLTLAARHLVIVYAIVSEGTHTVKTEWRNPLRRLRSRTEEEACGPLILDDDLMEFFKEVAPRWSVMNGEERDAIRLAIYSIHAFVDRSMEAGFLAMFSALEGLSKRWGSSARVLRTRIEALFQKHPPGIGGLWPIFDTPTEAGLYWIRNELAHGRMGGRFPEGALTVAHDHLQLWLEFALLAVLGHQTSANRNDWLRGQIPTQRDEVVRLQRTLAGHGT